MTAIATSVAVTLSARVKMSKASLIMSEVCLTSGSDDGRASFRIKGPAAAQGVEGQAQSVDQARGSEGVELVGEPVAGLGDLVGAELQGVDFGWRECAAVEN